MTTTTGGRPLLKDRAYEHIKTLILDGTYRPGQFISERDLTAKLDMSKTPIRAALERLEVEGFVTIAPQRGVIVRELNPREISDHYEFRMAIESWIVQQVAGRLTKAQSDELGANLALQHQQTGGPEIDVKGFMNSDVEFHRLITLCTGNAEFERAMRHQSDKLRRLVETIAMRDLTVPPRSCAEHQAIFEALIEGDGDRASRLVVEHLAHGRTFLLLGGSYGA